MHTVRCGDEAALRDLRWHWGDAYEVTEALGVWRAVRRDTQVALVAACPEGLHGLIVADYSRKPVPRT